MKTKAMSNGKLKLLSLEDEPRDAEIIRELLIDSGFDLVMDCTAIEKDFVSFLRGNTYDIILSDFKLPGFDGFAALRWVMEICPKVPFICVSGTIGEESAVNWQGFPLPSNEYLMKQRKKKHDSRRRKRCRKVRLDIGLSCNLLLMLLSVPTTMELSLDGIVVLNEFSATVIRKQPDNRSHH
jgi:CheY-like chemotaxis protein